MRPVIVLLGALLLTACSGGGASLAPGGSPIPSTLPAPTTATDAPGPTATPAPEPTPTPGPPTWSPVTPAGEGPAAREDHTWTVDERGSTAWLFGGRDGSKAFGDLWSYDLAADRWRMVEPATEGPPARFGHEGVWVEGVGLVVFAGQVGTTFFNDLWAYDPSTNAWTTLPASGEIPVARYGTCAALGPDGRLWISHGFTEDGTRFSDTRAYDFASGTWTRQTPEGPVPVARCLHGCWFTDDGRLTLYAGQTTGVPALADLWALSEPGTAAAAWTQLEGGLPPDRNLYAFARHSSEILVFGGLGSGNAYRNDAWRFDATTLEARPLEAEGEPPPGRSGATLVDDAARGRMLLFGGRNADAALSDVWVLTLP